MPVLGTEPCPSVAGIPSAALLWVEGLGGAERSQSERVAGGRDALGLEHHHSWEVKKLCAAHGGSLLGLPAAGIFPGSPN